MCARFYRFEKIEDDKSVGPYAYEGEQSLWCSGKNGAPLVGNYFMDVHHPGPWTDRNPKDGQCIGNLLEALEGDRALFGFASLEQLFNWFRWPDDFPILESWGYRIVECPMHESVVIGTKQAIIPEKVLRSSPELKYWLPVDFWITNHQMGEHSYETKG